MDEKGNRGSFSNLLIKTCRKTPESLHGKSVQFFSVSLQLNEVFVIHVCLTCALSDFWFIWAMFKYYCISKCQSFSSF